MNSVDGEIRIEAEDCQLEPIIQSEDQERAALVKAVAEEARRRVRANIANATTEVDFLRWNRAMLYCTTPEMINWMWDFGDVTVEDLLSEYSTDAREKEFNKEVSYLRELRGKLAWYPNKEGMVKVALKRIRETIGKMTIYRYRVLAEFPAGYYVKSSIYEWPEDRNTSEPHMVYFEPQNACVEHPCDDIYKACRETEGVTYIPIDTYNEIIGRLNDGHYMSGRDESDAKITKDPADFVLFALIGGFTNELRRVRISDFWNRQSGEFSEEI